MITTEVINEIYKKYNKKPKSVDYLDFALLFDKVGLMHDIIVDPEEMTLSINSIPEDSPFHNISLSNVNAFVPFEEWVAMVMHSSILFLNNRKPISSIHIKDHSLSLWDRIRGHK